MRKRLTGFILLSMLAASCRYLPFWPKEENPPNPDLILLVPQDTFPYPFPNEPIVPRLRGDTLFYLKGSLAGDMLCAGFLWLKELPDGPSREVLDFTTLIDSFPDNCVNFYDLWFSDTESLLVFTTGVPYDIPPSDTTQYPFHKLFLYDFVTGDLDTLDWGCPSYMGPRFSASGRYIFFLVGDAESPGQSSIGIYLLKNWQKYAVRQEDAHALSFGNARRPKNTANVSIRGSPGEKGAAAGRPRMSIRPTPKAGGRVEVKPARHPDGARRLLEGTGAGRYTMHQTRTNHEGGDVHDGCPSEGR